MSTHKNIDRICLIFLTFTLILSVLFINGESLGIRLTENSIGYENRLFDTSTVHTIDIVMEDWDSFIETCENEEYSVCSVIIDNEAFKNVGIRAKGNTSLTAVSSMGSDRYSFKIEFDQYDSTQNYHGLDKLSLNNIIQDNTYMKDYVVYQLMGQYGVASPLCSYAYITVNGEDWGLYLAVESVEESFLQRNYGSDYGELYKPDSSSMGGGRGNGKEFNMENFMEQSDSGGNDNTLLQPDSGGDDNIPLQPAPDGNSVPPAQPDSDGDDNHSFDGGKRGGGGMGGMGSDDVKLKYIDDDPDSYSNIFDNAKTDISNADKNRLIASLKSLSSGGQLEDVVDIDEVLRYFVVHNFVCNGDSYTGSIIHNYYLYEKDGQFSMIPWDYNLAFGTFQASGDAASAVNEPIDSPVSGGSTEDRPMLAWVFNDASYTELYHQYFSDFITQCFDSGSFSEMIDSVSQMIAPYVEKDPTKFCTYEEFELGVSTLKQFCLLRAQSVTGQLEGTIPSTSEGQSEDSSALIDASDISTTDMGTMDHDKGAMDHDKGAMGQDRGSMRHNRDSINDSPDSQNTDSVNHSTESEIQDDLSDTYQNINRKNNNISSSVTSAQNITTGIWLLGISVLVLLAGLLTAMKIKR